MWNRTSEQHVLRLDIAVAEGPCVRPVAVAVRQRTHELLEEPPRLRIDSRHIQRRRIHSYIHSPRIRQDEDSSDDSWNDGDGVVHAGGI